jgi:hypothetical protein
MAPNNQHYFKDDTNFNHPILEMVNYDMGSRDALQRYYKYLSQHICANKLRRSKMKELLQQHNLGKINKFRSLRSRIQNELLVYISEEQLVPIQNYLIDGLELLKNACDWYIDQIIDEIFN